MAKRVIFLVLLCSTMAFGQSADQSQSSTAPQQTSNEYNGAITVTGCVSQLNMSFILMQSDPSHGYKLQESSLSTSSPSATTANPPTLTIQSIRTIHKRCSAHGQ